MAEIQILWFLTNNRNTGKTALEILVFLIQYAKYVTYYTGCKYSIMYK
jgi:hypothetical protein